jgi:thiol:disulfide interchange protein DsbG
MRRSCVLPVGVSLIAFATLAFAGSDNPTAGPGAPSNAAVDGAVQSAPSTATATASGSDALLALAAPSDIDAVPVLKHIAATGAQLLDLGQAHGLRSVSARSGEQFMILQIAPDGQAVVGGPQLDLPVDRLMTLAAGQVKEL